MEPKVRRGVVDEVPNSGDFIQMYFALEKLVEFLWLEFDEPEARIEGSISNAISDAKRQTDDAERWGGFTVDIDISPGHDLDALERKLEQGESYLFDAKEVNALVRSGRLTAEDLEQLADEGDHYRSISGLIVEE